MFNLKSPGAVRYVVIVIATFLFSIPFEIVSPTASSPRPSIAQTSTNSAGKTKGASVSLENSNLQKASDNGSDPVNPVRSWSYFQNRKGNKGKKDKNAKDNTKIVCDPGPPGPPGPRGPIGPPGAQVTEATMMAEFRNMVQESANRRSRRIADQNISLMAAGIPDLLSAHHVVLRYAITIRKKTHQEVQNFKLPGDQAGTFVRGSDINLRSGRYVIRYTGVYHLTATLLISRDRDTNLRPRDFIKISICINSLCELNTALTTIAGMESNSLKFSVTITGMLMLKAGNYVSVYVENNTNKPLNIMEQSSFSGLMIGR